jgi:DNA-binding NtrC family response regulator
MAKVMLDISDGAQALTLRSLLARAGHSLVDDEPDVTMCDDAARAVRRAPQGPTLLLATASELRQAVDAMRQGVYGYLFVPLVPGEAEEMVRRAAMRDAAPGPAREFRPESLEEAEGRHIQAMLRHCRGNQAQAARLLGIGRNTLWRKLKKMRTHDDTGMA